MKFALLSILALTSSSFAYAAGGIISSGPPVRMVINCGEDLQVTQHGIKLFATSPALSKPIPVTVVSSDAPNAVKLVSDSAAQITIYVDKKEQAGLGHLGQIYVGQDNLGLICPYVDLSTLE